MPLVEIGALLDADPETFADALADVERQVDERIAVLHARRDMLHRLADGDRALLPDRACAILNRFVEARVPFPTTWPPNARASSWPGCWLRSSSTAS